MWLTITEAAKVADIDLSTLSRWIKAGKISCLPSKYNQHENRMVALADLFEVLKQKGREPKRSKEILEIKKTVNFNKKFTALN